MSAPKDPERYKKWIDSKSKAHKGKKLSDETKKKIRDATSGDKNPWFGKTHSDETKQHLIKINKNKVMDESVKEKIRCSMLGRPSPMRGRKQSESSRRKISDAIKERFKDKDIRLKLSIKMKELRNTPENKEKAKKTMCNNWKNKEFIKRVHETHDGDKTHLWKGGISYEPYCPKFTKEFKERVRSYWNYACVECGKKQEDNIKSLHVHHVNFRKDACCNKNVIPLFVPLCNKCHTTTNFNREFWEDWFTEIINEFYNGKCYYSKGEDPA